MRRTFCTTVLLVGALLAAGCDNEIDNPTTPPEPTMVTETFTGTINVNGAMNHNFNVATSGQVTLTLTEVAPDAAAQVGIALGTFNGANCFVVLPKDDAVKGNAVVGQSSGTGTLCARVYDPASRLTQPLTYTLTVVHP